MALSVADVLALPVVQRAKPEVLHGAGLDDRPVRWVHTSEIYDISPLLKGGEVLLTTGLGLVAAGESRARSYVRALAERQVAALVLELGRTFPTVPRDLVDQARAVDLPLIVLRDVVPFVEITETVHTLLVDSELARLRRGEEASERLNRVLINGTGLAALVAEIAALTDSPTALFDADGRLIAGTEADDPLIESAPPTGWPTLPEVAAVTVEARGGVLGYLRLEGEPTPDRAIVLERAALACALELSRSGNAAPLRDEVGALVLRDALSRRALPDELEARASGLGLRARSGYGVVGLSVSARDARSTAALLSAVREVARGVFGPSLVADDGDRVLVATRVHPRELRQSLAAFVDRLDTRLRAPGGSVVSAGPVSDDFSGLADSVEAARDTLELAERLTPAARVLVSADFALYQVLTTLVDADSLERFVTDQLERLLEHDARTGADLVRTLDVYLSVAGHKSRAAELLGIRRQTLYGRLERVRSLLGGVDLEGREQRLALDLALVSWRLRTAAATSW